MCGINGSFAYGTDRPIDRDALVRVRDHMQARGPDGAGLWLSPDQRLGLGHRRLAIIDLSEAAAQPMQSADGVDVVTFNGEIYNYRELKAGLEAEGYRFRSNSDTEVLLQLYRRDGDAFVDKLRGMFALALWDGRARRLLLARDAMGIKPLYYADDGRTLRFASQVKALLADPSVSPSIDAAGLVGFLLFGSVPEPHTMHAAIRAVPAGARLVVEEGRCGGPVGATSLAEVYGAAEAGAAPHVAPREMLREALLDSVRHHLVADVPVGVFLSAGLDSGALVGLMRDAGQGHIRAVTIAFDEFRGQSADEAPLARLVARHYGVEQTESVVTARDFATDLAHITAAMDQPSIDGVNTWFVAKAARAAGLKVAISGLGGDELLGGYPSFSDIPRWVQWMGLPSRVPGLGRLARRAIAGGLGHGLGLSPKAAGMLELGGDYAGAYLLRRGVFMPWEIADLIGADLARDGLERLDPLGHVRRVLAPMPATAFAKVAVLESSLYMRNQLLRDADWAGMAHGLEIRVPFVDLPLVEQLAPMTVRGAAQGERKFGLADAPSRALPPEVARRAKTGFTVPFQRWLGEIEARRAGSGSREPIREHWSRRMTRQMAQTLLAAG